MTSINPISLVPDLTEQAYHAILEAICDGRLAAGERITQERLAESLSVSRQPVLQAILLLKRDGLVIDAGGRGVMVAPLTVQHISQLYQVRSVLDGLAAREAAHRKANLSPALLARGRAAAGGRQISDMIEADLAFHRAIYAAAGNPLLSKSAEGHWSHIRRVMGAVLQESGLRDNIWDEHEAMLAAIASGDAALAQQLALNHCEAAGASLASRFDSQFNTPPAPPDTTDPASPTTRRQA